MANVSQRLVGRDYQPVSSSSSSSSSRYSSK
jgi:hypothetical protein